MLIFIINVSVKCIFWLFYTTITLCRLLHFWMVLTVWPSNCRFLSYWGCFSNLCLTLSFELYFRILSGCFISFFRIFPIGPQCQWDQVLARHSEHVASDLFSFVSSNFIIFPMRPACLAPFRALQFPWICIDAVSLPSGTTHLITWWNPFNYSKPNPQLSQTRHAFYAIIRHSFL